MTSPLFLGIDVGTSALKAVAVDELGDVRASASSPYQTISPQPGWTEQQPDDWWDACRRAVVALGDQITLSEVEAIGLAGQMHGSVFLDAEHNVIRPALLWNDQRTVTEAAEIEDAIGVERLVRITGNRAFTGFTAPKLLWLRRNAPISYKLLHHLLLPKDYVRLKLTGELATDAGDASGVGLLDVAQRRWSTEVIDALDVNANILPRVFQGPEITGTLRFDVGMELGLRGGIVVVAGAGDQQAGAVGAGAVRPGIGMTSIGTSAEVFATTASYVPEPQGRLHAMCHSVPGAWHTMGVMLSGGASLRWLAHAVAPIAGADALPKLAALAAASPPGARGLIFLPHLNGERTPHNDPAARGAFIGLSSEHTMGDMARAVVEGVAFNLRQILDITRATGAKIDEMRLIGGGARIEGWPQMLADVYEMPVRLLASEECTAFGAALLAATGAGAFASVQAATDVCVRVASEIVPNADAAAVYREQYERFSRVYGAMKDVLR